MIKAFVKKLGFRIQRNSSYKESQREIYELREAQRNLLRIFEAGKILKRFKYGYVDLSTSTYYPVLGSLYPHRYTGSGFFVAITKLLATVLECQMLGVVIKNVDNTLSMEMYKNGSFFNNWPAFFVDIDPQKAQIFAAHRPLDLAGVPEIANPHGDYQDIFNSLGREWIANFLEIYCSPSLVCQNISRKYVDSLDFHGSRPIAIYYRGTDKFREIQPAPLSNIYSIVNQICQDQPDSKVLIQTDQQQIRDDVSSHYKARCLFIADLPVTTGSVGLHHLENEAHKREHSGQQLVAMAESICRCSSLVTTTGNVGFFLAMKVFSQGGKVYQIKSSVK